MLTRSAADATRRSEKRVVFPIRQPPNEQRELERMIIAPHAGLAARHFATRRHVVPSVRAMINGVQQQALVFPIGGEIRLVEKRVRNRETRLKILFPGRPLSLRCEI